ncbi:MAG: TlpA disulfide reductase family protein [Chitinophagaceae bacterium]
MLRGVIIFFILLMYICRLEAQTHPVEVVHFDWYENLTQQKNDTTYIVNFWATWCVPCVEELPYFEKINELYKHQKVKVILVSLDALKRKESVLQPFINMKKIASTVLLLNEPDYNSWIDKVNSSWQGSLPATVIFNHQKKQYVFIENSVTFDILNQHIHKQ